MIGTEQFTAEDLALVEPDDSADLDAELAQEDARRISEMERLGFTPEEIGRATGRSPEEIAKPKPTLASLDAELDELRALRKSDRAKYWESGTQANEAALLAQREALKAEKATPAVSTDEGEDGDDIEQMIPESLAAEWRKEGGVEPNLAAVKFRLTIGMGDADPDEAASLLDSFQDDLDPEIQATIGSQLALDHGDRWRPAPDEDVSAFQETPWGAELITGWGDQAAKRLGVARAEADAIMRRLTEGSRLKVNRWVNSRSVPQRAAIIESLVARAIKRL